MLDIETVYDKLDEAAYNLEACLENGRKPIKNDLTELRKLIGDLCLDGFTYIVDKWMRDSPEIAKRIGWNQRS